MAIGDSNTYGFGAADVVLNGAWRYYFGNSIVSYIKDTPNWVGENSALGQGNSGSLMLGAIGQRIDQILSTYDAAGQFLRRTPNIALFLIGTNDCNQLNSGTWAGGSISTSIANMSTLLDNYRTACPNGVAIVSTLFPSTDAGVNSYIQQWNTALSPMIAARADVSKVFISDAYTAFTNNASWSTDYMWNFLHANGVGQQVIANTFLSTLLANVSFMPRTNASPHRVIVPHTASVLYNGTTGTDLGSAVFLDTSLPWAIEWECDLSPAKATGSLAGPIWEFKTDQSNGFKCIYNPPFRGIDFGSSTNFLRIFAGASPLQASSWNNISYGWHHFVIVFDGVSRTTLSSYKLYVDGSPVVLGTGSGLNAGNVNKLAADAVASASNLYMARCRIWNGGTTMTQTQVQNLYYFNQIPSGPTLTHAYLYTDGSGTTLTDSVGGANGTIGASGSWSSSIPTKLRTSASARTTASTRNNAV